MADVTGPGIRIPILADAKPFMKGMDKVLSKAKNAAQKLQKISKAMLIGGVAVTGAFALVTKRAGDAIETVNKFEAVFAKQAKAAGKFADALADAVGRSRYEIRDSLSSLQAFFVGLGFGGEAAQDLSQDIEKLTLDFASFYNVQDTDALMRFQSGLAGMSEPLRKYGINLLESAVQAEALAMGLGKGRKELTEQEKVLARYSIIMKSMTKQGAVGDAVRTAGSFVNRMKALRAQFTDTSVQIGTILIPTATRLLTKTTAIVAAVSEWMKQHPDFTRKLVKTVAILGGASVALGAIGLVLPQIVAGFAALKVIGLTGVGGGLIGAGLALIGLLVWKVPSVLAVIGGAVRLIGREIAIWAARIAAIFVKGFGWLPGVGGRGARAAGKWVSAQLNFMLKEQESDWNALFDIFEGKSKALPWEKAADATRQGGETIAEGIGDMGNTITDAIDDTAQQIIQAQEELMATLMPKKVPSAMYDPTKPGGTGPLFGKGLPGTVLPEFRVPLADLRELMRRSKDPMSVFRSYVARWERVGVERAHLRHRGYDAPAFPWEGKPFSALQHFAAELNKLSAKPTVEMEVNVEAANMEEVGEIVADEIQAALAAAGMDVDTSLLGD